MLKIKRYENELDKTRQGIKSIQKGGMPENVGAFGGNGANPRPSSGLWKAKEQNTESDVPKRSMSKGKI